MPCPRETGAATTATSNARNSFFIVRLLESKRSHRLRELSDQTRKGRHHDSKIKDQSRAEGVYIALASRVSHTPEAMGIVPQQAGVGREIPIQADGDRLLDAC